MATMEHKSPKARRLLAHLRLTYLTDCGTDGGSAGGFRQYADNYFVKNPEEMSVLARDAWAEATTHCWRQQPRKTGVDLFSINGLAIGETITRYSAIYYDEGVEDRDANEDDETNYEKVLAGCATVKDLTEDALIKVRKSLEGGNAAQKAMNAASEARRRAKGDDRVFLRDIADKSV